MKPWAVKRSRARTLPNSPVSATKSVKRTVYVAAFVASMGGLVFGWDIGGGGGTVRIALRAAFLCISQRCLCPRSKCHHLSYTRIKYVMEPFRREMGWPPVPQKGQGEPTWVSTQQGLLIAMFSVGALFGALPSVNHSFTHSRPRDSQSHTLSVVRVQRDQLVRT